MVDFGMIMDVPLFREDSLVATFLHRRIIEDESIDSSLIRRVAVTALAAIAVLWGYVSCYPYVAASLADPNRWVAGLSVVGSIAGFGSFAAYHLLKCIQMATAERSFEEKELRVHYEYRAVVVTIVAVSIILGIYSQFPLTEVAMAFSPILWLGIVGAIISVSGAAAPPGLSLYQGLKWVEYHIREKSNILGLFGKVYQKAQATKTLIVANCRENLDEGLRCDMATRQLRFSGIYQSTDDSVQKKITQLEKNFFTVPRFSHRAVASKIVVYPSRALYVVGTVATMAFLLETALLARDLAKEITSNAGFIYGTALLSVTPWIYACLTVPGEALGTIYQQFTDLFDFERDKSFVEQYFPKASKGLYLASLLLSWCAYGAIVSVAEQYFNPQKVLGDVLLSGSLLTVTSFFFYSINKISEYFLEFAASRGIAGEEVAHAYDFKRRVSLMIGGMERLSLDDVVAFIEYLHADINDDGPELSLRDLAEMRMQWSEGSI
ncbi:MAG: hypothetical protein H7A37_04495 [Chlamydiales bacterium]|nr:hypothetical protein [Chlamydiia bacterium]MCP5507543.1 hypothetical protein [Chlamydiales bacterium]